MSSVFCARCCRSFAVPKGKNKCSLFVAFKLDRRPLLCAKNNPTARKHHPAQKHPPSAPLQPSQNQLVTPNCHRAQFSRTALPNYLIHIVFCYPWCFHRRCIFFICISVECISYYRRITILYFIMIFLLHPVLLLLLTDCVPFAVSNLGVVLTGVHNETQIYWARSFLVRSLMNYSLFSNIFHEVAFFFHTNSLKSRYIFDFWLSQCC